MQQHSWGAELALYQLKCCGTKKIALTAYGKKKKKKNSMVES